jgi:hypothetical protein
MNIRKVNVLPNDELLVDHFCYIWDRLEQTHMKLIDGVVHQTSLSGYMWTPANAETNYEVLRELRLVSQLTHTNN